MSLIIGFIILYQASMAEGCNRDTFYIVFKKDNLHQIMSVDTNTYTSRCTFQHTKVSFKVFTYLNSFKLNSDSIETRYELSFIQRGFLWMDFLKDQSSNKLEVLEKKYRLLKQKNDPCALEIRDAIELKKRRKPAYLYQQKNIIYLDSIVNLDEMESLLKKIFGNKIYIVDVSSGAEPGNNIYEVSAIPLLPIRGKHMF